MRRVPTIVVTALLLLGVLDLPADAARRGKQVKPTRPGKLATWRSGAVRLHDTPRGHKETQAHPAKYSTLARPGGRLMYSGAEMVRWACGHVKGQANGLMSHYLRDSGGNRFGIDMRPDGVTVTARVTDIAPAARPAGRPASFHSVRRDRQNPLRELHAFEYTARDTVSLSNARAIAMKNYRVRHPEAKSVLVPSRERLVVRPDGTQRLTISFDPSKKSARLPLD